MVNRANQNEGVLIDLDIAARVNEAGDPVDSDALPVAGTLQYRACDLVKPGTPAKAYYRHDLESFLYTLLWIQLHYKNGVYHRHPQAHVAEFDFKGTWASTHTSKEGFLSLYDGTDEQLPYIPLRDAWLAPLRALFGEAFDAPVYAAISAHKTGNISPVFDKETYGGALTFDKFLSIINRD